MVHTCCRRQLWPAWCAGLAILLGCTLGSAPGSVVSAQEPEPAETAPAEDHDTPDSDHPEGDHPEGDHPEGDHAGGHHNEFDLSHANASPDLENPAEFRFDLAIFSFVVFLLLMGILLKFAWKPIMEGLERRESTIAAMIEEAKQNQIAAAKQLKEYEARLDRAAEEARVVVSQAHDDAQAAADQIRKESKEDADKERQRALADIQSAKNAALDDLTQKSVDLALGLAGNIVRKQLNPSDHAQLIQDYLEQIPDNRLTNNN